MVYVFLADGFETVEALTPVDMLIRAGASVLTVSVTGDLMVTSAQGICIRADILFESEDFHDAEMFIFPGGQPGVNNLCRHDRLEKLVRRFAQKSLSMAAICAGPLVLGKCGVLKGRKATVFPGNEESLVGVECTGKLVEQDGNIITAIGPAASFEFSKAIIKLLRGERIMNSVCDAMQFDKQ